MIPSAGTRTMTRFGLVWPARKLRFDARGGEPWSPGYTVRKLGAVGSVTVTFIATATTPESGTTLRVGARVEVSRGRERMEAPAGRARGQRVVAGDVDDDVGVARVVVDAHQAERAEANGDEIGDRRTGRPVEVRRHRA